MRIGYARRCSAYRLRHGRRFVEREVRVKNLWERMRLVRTRRDEGASAVEYGLLVALIAVVIAGTVVALGSTLKDRFDQATCEVANPSTTDACTVVDGPGNGRTQ